MFEIPVFETGKEVDIMSATGMELLWKNANVLSISQKPV